MKKKPQAPIGLRKEVQKLDRGELRKAVVMKEILGKPKAINKNKKF